MTKREDEIFERRIAKDAELGAFAHDLTVRLGYKPTFKMKKQKEWVVQEKGKVPDTAAAILRYPNLLTEQMLAARWHCSSSRLQYWRSHGKGLPYLKFGGRVLYRIEDVLAFEKDNLRNQCT